jgi:hypothetical protein
LQPLHQSLLVEGQEDDAGEAAAEALDGDEEPVGLEALLAQASGDTGHNLVYVLSASLCCCVHRFAGYVCSLQHVMEQ